MPPWLCLRAWRNDGKHGATYPLPRWEIQEEDKRSEIQGMRGVDSALGL